MRANPVRREGIMERQVGDERMLYDAVGRAVHVLNETAYFIWERCDGKHSADEIVAEAVQLSDLPEEELRIDVEGCIETFRALAIVL